MTMHTADSRCEGEWVCGSFRALPEEEQWLAGCLNATQIVPKATVNAMTVR